MLVFSLIIHSVSLKNSVSLSFLELFDLLLRALVIGQLSIISTVIWSKTKSLSAALSLVVMMCLSAYIALTAPIDNHHYGALRGILLFFTEILPYSLWGLAFALLKDGFSPRNWPRSIKLLITISLCWFAYFFGYLQGKGWFHQVNHAVQLLVLVHIIVVALKDFSDDLVDERRRTRLVLVIASCFYFCLIVLAELTDLTLRGSLYFGLVNVCLILLSSTIFSWFLMNGRFDKKAIQAKAIEQEEAEAVAIPGYYQRQYQALCQLMSEGFYREPQLTIKVLADKLTMPEHQLRELINQCLGFRNFSIFLNSYRLAEACQQLEESINHRKPILTIALELGYGSIATFNRAFKQQLGKTPKEYRQSFQK